MSKQDENELLIEGKVPEVSDLDNHSDHVKSHLELLSDPNNKNKENVVEAVLEHCKKHNNALYEIAMKNANAFGVQNLYEVLEDE